MYSDHSKGRRRFDVRRQTYKKFREKFFSKNFFCLKNTFKSSQHKKVKKKFFFGQIGLEFLAPHGSAFFAIILRWAPVDRKMLSGDLDGFIEKIL